MQKTGKKKFKDAPEPTEIDANPESSPPDVAPQQETMFEPAAEDRSTAEDPAEAEPDQPGTEAEPETRRKGRPRKEDTPAPTIIERIKKFTDWEGRFVYVYRKEPYSNRRVGNNTFVMIQRYERAIDEQDLLNDHGSGLYQLRVVYDNPDPKVGRLMILRADVRVMNMKYPPKVPKGEWVEDPRNADWAWAKDAIDQKDAATVAKQAVQDSGTALFAPLLDMMKDQLTATREELRAVRESSANRNTGEQTIMSVLAPFVPAIVARLTAPPPPPPPAADPFAMMTAALTFMDKVRPPVTEQPKDAAAELDRVLDLQDKMEARMGGGKNSGRSRKTGWQELIADVAPSAAQVLTPIMQMILSGMNRAQQQAGMPPMQMNPNQAQLPQPELTEVQQQPGPGVGPRPVEHRKQPTVEGFADKVLELLKEEADGYQLGDWYVDEFGIDEMNDVREQGKPQILKDLKSCPNPWRFIAVYEESGALDKFLREFVTWEPGVEDAEEEEESPPDEPTAQHQTDMQAGWMPAQETV